MKLGNIALVVVLLAQNLIPTPMQQLDGPAFDPVSYLQQAIQGFIRPTQTPTSTPTAETPSETPIPTETPIPSETPPPIIETPIPSATSEPVMGFSLKVDPQTVKPGEQFVLFWQIDGMEEIMEDAFLRFHVPAGLLLFDVETAKTDEEYGTIDLPIASASGKVAWQTDPSISLPIWITAEFWQGGETQLKAEVELQALEETAIDVRGGEAVGLNDQVRVTFPEGSLSESVKVRVGRPSAEALPVESLSGSPFEITAVSENTKAEVSEFAKPVEIRVRYGELGQGSEEDTVLYWYDPSDGYWKLPLRQHVDTENNLIIAYTDHFTIFDTYNSNWQTAETPTMNSFQHAGFTGGSSFSMPIKVPAGPGGFQPSLTLSYSSSTVDNVSSESQASWVGMGWSLTTSFIERNGHGTNNIGDDSYQLNLNGMSVELLPDANGIYHASDENFYKVEFTVPIPGGHNESTWTIWDKSGNRYFFERRTYYFHSQECDNGYEFAQYVWRWSLSRVRNIHGQEMTYSYEEDTKDIAFFDCEGNLDGKTVSTWVYPTEIRYANNRYRIVFDRDEARSDYKNLWTSPYSLQMAFQQSLLTTLIIQQDDDGTGFDDNDPIIRKYVFTYATDPADHIFPYLIWEAGGRTPTLLSVQEYGLNEAQALPPYTFEYGDGMHLTNGTNGYGGSVDFVYDHDTTYVNPNPWHESIPFDTWEDDLGDFETPAWGNPLTYRFRGSADGWTGAQPYPTSGVIYNGGGLGTLSVWGQVQNVNIYSTAKSFQPGRWYEIVASVKRDNTVGTHTMQLGFGYKDTNGAIQDLWGTSATLTSSFQTISSGPIFLPVNASQVIPKMNSIGINRVDWYYLYPLPTPYRVTSRTLSSGTASYAFNYTYEGAATNSPAISEAAAGFHPYNRPYSEFRGHSQVTETDPNGMKTITAYHQDDLYSGRSSMVTIKNAGNAILQTTSSSYDFDEWEADLTLVDEDSSNPFTYNTPFDPLYYRWAWTASETKDVYRVSPSNVVDGSLLTEYIYESTYGNLITKTQTGGGVTLVTHTDYFPNASTNAWLVGLPARTWVTDGGGNTLAESLNLYDGANLYTATPTAGRLTATRSWVSGNLGTGNYSQTSMTYDAWGNATSQTAWTGYGTRDSAPTEGARTSYTCYGSGGTLGGSACADDGYHTYALWTKNPLGHVSTVTYDYAKGLPLSETDPNGAVTTATYDVFGRFTSLARPSASGPSETPPSLNVSYQNSPFKVTLTQAIDTGLTFTVVRDYDGMGRQTSTVTNGVTVASTFNAYGKPLTQSMPHASGAWYYTTTAYDSMGRPVTVTPPDGSATTYTYNGLTTSVTDAKNHTHTTVTDILGRTLSVTPPTGPEVTFTYDPLGNMKTATRGGATMAMDYDNVGRKVAMDDPDLGAVGTPIDESWGWTYQYDALAMTSQTDLRGCVTNIGYDLLGRPLTKTYQNCPSTGNVTYTYDTGTNGIGRRVSMSVTGGDYTSWNYDIRGRVTSENKQIPGGQFVTGFTYNSADLPVTMTYPVDNEVVTFKYNNNMLVEKVFNDMGTPTNLADDINYAQSIAYDSAMRMIQLVRGANKINTIFDYNDWDADGGRLFNLTSTQVSTGTPLQNSTYNYDSVGNIETITDSLLGPQTQAFQYDELDRLTNSNVTGGTNGLYSESYTYEAGTGNLKTKNGVTYTYNTTHKHAVASLSNGNTYGYDANGNMTSRHVGSQNFTLTYDAENRLVSVTGAATASFIYDGDGRQVKSVVNGVTTYYVGNHYEKKGTTVTKYYFAGSTRLAVRTGGTLRFLLGDHLGSSSVTTDANGAKTASALYKAFGETRYTLGNLGTDYKFTGQREEASLGIYFFNARWMDPSLGRFTSPDTLVPTGTQGTQAWDRYAFVNNNPVRYTDPTGHEITNTTITTTTITFTSAADFNKVANIAISNISFMRGIQSKLLIGGATVIGVLGLAGGTIASGGHAEFGVAVGGILGGGAYGLGAEVLLDQYDQDLDNLTLMKTDVTSLFTPDGTTGISASNVTMTITEESISLGVLSAPIAVQTITICSNLGECFSYTSSPCPSNQHAIDRIFTTPVEEKPESENANDDGEHGV